MKERQEIASEILIAAIAAKAVQITGSTADAQAETLMRVYGIILGGLTSPPEPRLPKPKE
ncbi:MAG: hypothetical protein U1F26_17845 [Lysobacterales bacterium]